MEEEGEKKTVLLMSLNKRERTQTFKSRRKVPKPRTSEKKKSHKSDLRLYELKTTNKVFLKNRITAFLFSTMRNYTVVQKKKKRTCSRTNSIHTSHTVESTPSRIYLCTTSKKGRGKKLRPFLCVCFVAFRTRYRKKKRDTIVAEEARQQQQQLKKKKKIEKKKKKEHVQQLYTLEEVRK